MNKTVADPESLLPRFGLTKFRRGQRNVIDAILAGRDTLCIMPTGGGKSLCYQLPALARDGITIVISPLIALMKDQVDSLSELDIPATFINSTLASQQQHARIDGMIRGEYKLVYIAPERLRSSTFMRATGRANIAMLAIDEAHCISQWGHDFRPDYARLGRMRSRLGNPQTVALTATATELVRQDIVQILELEEPATFISGFARENLYLRVDSPGSNSEKDEQLISFLNSHPGCGIVYASTRKSCEHIVELLDGQIDRPVTFYHAGLPPETRKKVQEDFMSGRMPVIVATNAFGMGIDKADLRFVAHYNIPGSIEAYYQEAGRAGRDGKPSECMLLYSYQDKFIQEFFIENSYPSRQIVKEIYEFLRSVKADPIEMTLMEIKDELDLDIGTSGIANCENLLEKAGAIERLDSRENMAAIRIDSELTTLIDLLPRDARVQRHVMRGLEKLVGPLRGERVMFVPQKLADRLEMKWQTLNRHIRELTRLDAVDYVPPFRGRAIHLLCRDKRFAELDIDFAELERRKQSEFKKLQSVIDFCTTRRCRQLQILEYFGDPERHLCRSCDNCKKAKQRPAGPAPKHADNDACLYAAQVALSGIARTHGRFGKTIIAQMLTGSTAKKVERFGLSRLSTFGLLKGLKQNDASSLIDWLVDEGYAVQSETTRYRPQVKITPRGLELVGGRLQPDLVAHMPGPVVNSLSIKFKGKVPHRVEESPDDEIEIVRPDGEEKSAASVDVELDVSSSPAEEVTEEIEENLPGEEEEEENLPGEGAAPGQPEESILESTGSVAKPLRIHREDLPHPEKVQPSFYWTWRLIADGYSPLHLQQARDIDLDTIYDHLIQAADNDYEVEASWMLSGHEASAIAKIVDSGENKRLTALIAELPAEISPKQLMFFLKCQ
ncbi:MAG: RecQ family ATP-dependent DNA helicase [Planctomycetota bacterium]